MPLREFACTKCNIINEVYHPAIDPSKVPSRNCKCGKPMQILWSTCKVDTADSFHPFPYQGPDGRKWEITNLHKLRQVEHEYTKTGHNVRFDAYNADPSNPDSIDGMGQPYWDGNPNSTSGKLYSTMN